MIQTNNRLVKELGTRLKMLKDRRALWESDWNSVIELVNPRRGTTREGDTTSKKRGRESYCSAALEALKIWVSGMQGYLVGPTIKWFQLSIPDKGLRQSRAIKHWLQETEEAMYAEFNRSNFYSAMNEYFWNAGSIGTSVMLAEEDIVDGTIDFAVRHHRECYIAENHKGRVDTLYREFPMSLRNLASAFGIKGLPDSIQNAVEKTPYAMHTVYHAIYPATDKTDDLDLDFRKPFVSVYWINEADTLLRSGGYDIFQAACWRTRKNVDEEYGRSPGMDALVDVMSLNVISKDMLRLVQLAAEPPLNVPEEFRGRARFDPGAKNSYTDPNKRIEAMNVVGDLRGAMEFRSEYKQAVRAQFNADFFLMLSMSENPQKTATEILERRTEKAIILGSEVGSLVRECLVPVMDIVFDIACRAGRIPDIPDELAYSTETGFDYDFIGPLAQAQKEVFEKQGIAKGLNDLAPITTLYPEARHLVDPIILTRRVLEANNFPQEAMRTDEQIQEIIDAERQQQASLQQAQVADQVAGAANKASKAIEPGSPADLAMAGAGL